MLFKEVHLQGIRSGKITLAFRKWEKAAVKKGTLLKTSIGLVEIIGITTIGEDKIPGNDILNAGFDSKEQLLKSFRQDGKGSIYRIRVQYYSADPRIELSQQNLTEEKILELKGKLARLDKFSKQGNWTETALLTIQNNPYLHAIGLARLTGFEKEWLKLNIRKLKNLGLTISHSIGYELSPLGKQFVQEIKNNNQ